MSGANRGLGLEMAMALVEAGARAVYCVDLPKTPGEEWGKVREYVGRMKGKTGEGRLEYISGNVTDQVYHLRPSFRRFGFLVSMLLMDFCFSEGCDVEDWRDDWE